MMAGKSVFTYFNPSTFLLLLVYVPSSARPPRDSAAGCCVPSRQVRKPHPPNPVSSRPSGSCSNSGLLVGSALSRGRCCFCCRHVLSALRARGFVVPRSDLLAVAAPALLRGLVVDPPGILNVADFLQGSQPRLILLRCRLQLSAMFHLGEDSLHSREDLSS